MMQAERAVKAKKGKGGKKSDLQLEAEPEDDVSPSEIDSDAAQRAARRANREEAIAAKKADKEAEREKQKEIAQIKQHNSRVNILASKALTALTAPRDTLVTMKKSKSYAHAPPFVKERLDNALEEAVGYIDLADKVIKNLKQCSKEGSKLPDFEFSVADLNRCAKDMKQATSDIMNFERLFSSRQFVIAKTTWRAVCARRGI